jgi:hypothetical protein
MAIELRDFLLTSRWRGTGLIPRCLIMAFELADCKKEINDIGFDGFLIIVLNAN